MLDELRDQIASYLAHHRVCIISTAGAQGAWAMPVRYHSRGLEVDCLVPRWADVAYHLEQDPRACPEHSRRVMLVIPAANGNGLRWLQYQGTARPVAAPDWAELLPGWMSTAPPDELYLVIRMTPQRIDLFDESRGWGVRETLEA
jgi:hypothetical protein